MKKIKYISLFMIAIFSLSACHRQPTSKTSGTIMDIRQNTITMLTDDFKSTNGEQKQGDLSFAWEEATDFKTGDRIEITIQGPIRETFPAMAEVTNVKKIAD